MTTGCWWEKKNGVWGCRQFVWVSEKKDGDNGDVMDKKGGKSKCNVSSLTRFEVGTMGGGFYLHNFAAEYIMNRG